MDGSCGSEPNGYNEPDPCNEEPDCEGAVDGPVDDPADAVGASGCEAQPEVKDDAEAELGKCNAEAAEGSKKGEGGEGGGGEGGQEDEREEEEEKEKDKEEEERQRRKIFEDSKEREDERESSEDTSDDAHGTAAPENAAEIRSKLVHKAKDPALAGLLAAATVHSTPTAA
eukprot:Skav218874  [mRNA]  locus=scaffold2503:48285:50357:+ [translate_table: standard]